ncbi:hypothetical protein N0V88_002156 [Collariella sp. IMI 366227]|nr:hypothetical protein N0V88_002156 [Collariella sp. IMI 366227]
MPSFKLQSQPSRPPPPFDPVVEAWLDSIPPPVVRPSAKELRQWRLRNYHGLGRNVFITCLILRGVSFAVALVVTGIISSTVAGRSGFGAPAVVLWDTAEFLVAAWHGDMGISPIFHVIVDGLLFVGIAIATGILLIDVVCGITDLGPKFDSAAKEIASACFLIVLM